jgi:acetyl esterase/lipase
MVSEAAKRVIERIRAENSGPELDLDAARANWIAGSKELTLPAGAVFAVTEAGGIAAEWMDTPGAQPDRLLLLLHGGGYNAGSPVTHRKLAALLGLATGTRVLTPDYRLAPEHPFPAAPEDALAVWNWLTTEGGREPASIVVAGDSAGGGLALTMMLMLRDAGRQQPLAAVLLSPWTDLSVSGRSYETNRASDPGITREGLLRAGAWYAGKLPVTHPLASPLFADLKGLPPLLIHAGGAEAMLDDSRVFAERAGAAGVEVTFREWPGLWHVHQHEAPEVPEAVQAIAEIGAFVKGRFTR